jgi:hypothetical protein
MQFKSVIAPESQTRACMTQNRKQERNNEVEVAKRQDVEVESDLLHSLHPMQNHPMTRHLQIDEEEIGCFEWHLSEQRFL